MKNKQKELINIDNVYDFWKEWAQTLEKKDININIADFDDTLFSRDEQLENEKWLKENRWDTWTKFIFEKVWMMKFLEKYYKNKSIPKDIISKMNPKYDIILTAWIYEFQIAKIRLCKELYNFKNIITKDWKEKIIALIRYVLFDLWFLPSKITIYEDRPNYFIEYKDLLQDILWCKLEIIYVEMNWNDWYKNNIEN